jgi:hypothetical protein
VAGSRIAGVDGRGHRFFKGQPAISGGTQLESSTVVGCRAVIDDAISRFVPELLDRIHGPFSIRFVLQPAMALLYATRDGLKDAHKGRPAYFWAIFHSAREQRRELLHEGWTAMARVIALGAIIDALYQIIVLRGFRPLELVVIVFTLAFVPYLLLRGPINRLAARRRLRKVRGG